MRVAERTYLRFLGCLHDLSGLAPKDYAAVFATQHFALAYHGSV
ncbi:MAG: hypothetical protein ACREAO_03440 [Nitrososphaera sp.]